jgi:hypothetical protein
VYEKRFVNAVHRAAWRFVSFFALTVIAGCSDNNIALVGRETLTGREVPDEIVATVERLDTSSREIHLSGIDRRSRVVGYSADTQVVYRGREYPVTQLEVGDSVAMQLKQDPGGSAYTDLIRVQQSVRDRSQHGGDVASPATAFQTLEGRVERLDLERRSFELRNRSGERIVVSLPNDAPRSAVDHLRRLQAGDYVRIEGQFMDRERFEVETFLQANR